MSFKTIYTENLQRLSEADNLEIGGITEDGENLGEDGGDDVAYFCVFAHIPGEGIIDLLDVDTYVEAVEWRDAIVAIAPNLQ